MIPLRGNSGCKISIIDNFTIRKQSKSTEYNNRLLKQIEKQKSFTHPILKTPKIYNIGKENDLLFFDMEYVKGENFYDFCAVQKFNQIEHIIKLFFPIKDKIKTTNVSDLLLNSL